MDLEVKKLVERVKQKDIQLVLDAKAREFLIEKGFDPAYGARPMRRAVEKYLEDPLAEDDAPSLQRFTATAGPRVQVVADDFICTNATRIRDDVWYDQDATVTQDVVGFWCGWTICTLKNNLSFDLVRVCFCDLLFQCGWNHDVAID